MKKPLSPKDELQLRRSYHNCYAQILRWGEERVPLNQFLNRTLQIVGLEREVSRAYVFRMDRARGRMLGTHEWTAEGITPYLGLEASFDDFPYWVAQLEANRIIVGSNIRRDLPAEVHEVLTMQDILSILVGPLQVAGELWGFMGLDECSVSREWTHLEAELFHGLCRAAAAVIGQTPVRTGSSVLSPRGEMVPD